MLIALYLVLIGVLDGVKHIIGVPKDSGFAGVTSVMVVSRQLQTSLITIQKILKSTVVARKSVGFLQLMKLHARL